MDFQLYSWTTPNLDKIQKALETLCTFGNVEDKNIDIFMIGFLLRCDNLKNQQSLTDMISQMNQYIYEIKLASQSDKFKIDSQEEEKQSMKLIEQLKYQEYMEEEKLRHMREIDEKLSKQLLENEEEQKNQDNILMQKQQQEEIQDECQICLTGLYDNNFWPIYNCGDVFHVACLQQYFKQEIEARKFPIKCPSEKCQEQVIQSDMSEVLEQQYIDNFYQYTLNQFIDMHSDELNWCPTANCRYAFAIDNKNIDFICPNCKKRYCLQCKCEYHVDMSCQDYTKYRNYDINDIQFLKFVKGEKYKQCPKCKFWVQKNEGCDHMTCRCGEEFCWRCGGPYESCYCIDGKPPDDIPQYSEQHMLEILERQQEQEQNPNKYKHLVDFVKKKDNQEDRRKRKKNINIRQKRR